MSENPPVRLVKVVEGVVEIELTMIIFPDKAVEQCQVTFADGSKRYFTTRYDDMRKVACLAKDYRWRHWNDVNEDSNENV